MENKLRIVIADDERPARTFLKAILESFEDVEIVGVAENGAEAIEIIEKVKPDLALLDLQMPIATGFEVVKVLKKKHLPLIAFVTAFDEYAIQAFEINAVDYLLKPVERGRVRETLNRVHERLEEKDFREREAAKVKAAMEVYEEINSEPLLERIPVKRDESIYLLPVDEVASIMAEGELLHLTTIKNEQFSMNFRLKDLEARLSPEKFIRLSRSSLVNLQMITKIHPLPGGTYSVTLKNKQQVLVSRIQSRIFRNQFLRLS